MKPPADGWDREEREALEPLRDELAAMRDRHAGDPPLDLLRAAAADALPEDLQARVSEHLTESPWSRALVAGIADAEAPLDAAAERRLLARITRSSDGGRSWFSTARWWVPLLASSAVVAIVATAWVSWRAAAPATPASTVAGEPVAVARSEPAPFQLPLQKPDVRLSVGALTWRGPSGAASLVDDLAPALDAYRSSDYARAAQALETLERRYPNAIEPPFYRGISLLYLNDPAAAIEELTKAGRLADDTFSPDVAWYLAVAEQRAGRTAPARARLDVLCRGAKAHASDACDAIAKLSAGR